MVGVVQTFAQPFPFDYSYVGYRQSEQTIPDADVVVFVKWQDGDQSARIQKAIDYVSARKVNGKTGLRGAVLLDKGVFRLSQPLRIQASGVVLRGTDRNATVLMKTGVDRGAVVYMESNRPMQPAGNPLAVVSDRVELGARSLQIAATEGLKPGDEVLIVRPSTKEWIDRMGCSDFGAGKDLGYWGWHPGEIDVRWTRRIVEANGSSLSFDAPLSMTLDRSMGKATYSASHRTGGASVT